MKPVGLLNRKLKDPKYRKRFERDYELFKLEAQILLAMEDQGLTYEDLATKLGTYRSMICRDLRYGGLKVAKLYRIMRMVDALGLRLVLRLKKASL